jgi:DNA-binding LacI/PurR family transcriptional regulator
MESTNSDSDTKPDKQDVPKRRGMVSQRDVARKAGVSQSTVSRVFSHGDYLTAEARETVLQAAEELGYRPNAIARSLVRGTTQMIGLVVTPFFNPYYSHVIRLFTRALQDRGYWTMLLNVPDQLSAEETLPMALRYRLDGLIFTSASLSSRLVNECLHSATPVILFNRYVLDDDVDSVFCDNLEGGSMVADMLLAGGHERFAYVAGEQDTSTNMDREQGFATRLHERGRELEFRESGDDTYGAGCAAARRLLRSDKPPDAIFCANDLMACGALDVARREFGVVIPDDLSIVGFDDIPMASWSAYSLTTVRQPVEEMVACTIELLTDAASKGPGKAAVMRSIPPRLVMRTSARIGTD